MTVGKAAAFLLCGVMSLSTLTVAASPSGTPVAQSAEQGTVKVSGLVLDENGEPIIGATIAEVGTKRGTSTDVNGKFTLSVAGKSNYSANSHAAAIHA
ncbi:MAG: carboxypeptidase-like regulatory domain-containing protein [Bacteroidales bacterium]|nr:carboxypeptidase-like regulatory domain-containing protein [Bacteroidales bacterium]